jgi:hypothetical protein
MHPVARLLLLLLLLLYCGLAWACVQLTGCIDVLSKA